MNYKFEDAEGWEMPALRAGSQFTPGVCKD